MHTRVRHAQGNTAVVGGPATLGIRQLRMTRLRYDGFVATKKVVALKKPRAVNTPPQEDRTTRTETRRKGGNSSISRPKQHPTPQHSTTHVEATATAVVPTKSLSKQASQRSIRYTTRLDRPPRAHFLSSHHLLQQVDHRDERVVQPLRHDLLLTPLRQSLHVRAEDLHEGGGRGGRVECARGADGRRLPSGA